MSQDNPPKKFPAIQFIMALSALAGAYYTYDSNRQSTDSKIYTECLNHTRHLEDQVLKARTKCEKIALSYAMLKEEAEVTEESALYNFLDNFPLPAWVKLVKQEGRVTTYRMLFVNDAYGDFFQIEPEYYVNKTDYDIYGLAKAREYRKSDDEVRKSPRGYIRLEQKVLTEGGEKSVIVYKFRVRFTSGRIAIAGFILN